MIKNIYSVLCAEIIEDVRTHLISYINCIEGLKTAQFPAILPNVNIGSYWSIEPPKDKVIKL